ncbi:hypothetical protein GLS40_07785 [Pseudooceanicola sp. 216_PA32_1]|uniref:PRC-barrel domain-containing protein n=1 Tax=Pseudooceanicola pacificus TaxID=2676438 RepID=A0A844WDT5_9RHOB|nr:PRC-barrel domain-containing protein [Pseudooceanicola pacificus]MWB77920.1 hypothetical protein [Pseudooceanicola pacificus]
MTTIKATLMSGAAAIALLAAPLSAQTADSDAATSSRLGDGEISAQAEASGDTETLRDKAREAVDAAGQALEKTGEAIGNAATATVDAASDTAEAGAEAVAEGTDSAATAIADSEDRMAGDAAATAGGTMTAGSLVGANVASSSGEPIGEIDRVVRINDEVMAVIGVGGFLGIGEHEVALPITELGWQGETVTAFGYSEEQLKSMAAYDAELATAVEADEPVTLGRS